MLFAEAEKYLKSIKQEHLLQYFGELSEKEKALLLKDIQTADFSVTEAVKLQKKQKFTAPEPIEAVSADDIRRRKQQFTDVGLSVLAEGKVGAVLLSGGQGSRLGFAHAKGMYNIGVTRELSIFECQFNNINEVASLTGRHFPVFVMTGEGNRDETVEFFERNNYFGYPKERIFFYVQETAPACDYEGKVFLSEKHRIAMLPNGNGGWYSSLINSGLGKVIENEELEWLNVYSVDNVLQKICDPSFIGATVMKRCDCGAKVVRKTDAQEKVGVLCKQNGKPSVIEYYEMPDELKNLKENGELVFRYGVILNYIFSVRTLNAIMRKKLPYHVAEKAFAHIENGEKVTPKAPCGYKFETLIVDMIQDMQSCLAYEVERTREFAPVKNAVGVDSVETARELLRKNGVNL